MIKIILREKRQDKKLTLDFNKMNIIDKNSNIKSILKPKKLFFKTINNSLFQRNN